MLLETLDDNDKNLVVYSRNILNSENNFRMIIKNKKKRSSKKLFIYDICGLINNSSPKNLIVYRLLTNITDLCLNECKYGCVIKTDEGTEIVYTDPLYAVQEIDEFLDKKYLPDLKFRIQQVGFTSEPEKDSIKFKELFHFDLDAAEAKAQDDSVFVEALLLDKNKIDSKGNAYFDYLIQEEINADKEEVFIKEGEENNFQKISGYDVKEEKKINKSNFQIFKSLISLKSYINPGKRRKIFLRFRKH